MQIASSIAIAAFVLAQLGIGYWASKRVAKEDDYIVAGKKLGMKVAAFSMFVSFFGAESIFGSSAAIREEGLAGGRADPLGYAFALFLFGLLYAAAIYRTGALTLVDVYLKRFGLTASKIGALVCIPPSVLWCGAQMRALGQLLSLQTPLSLEVAIVLAAAIAILYTYWGGLLGDVWTDVFQGAVALIGLTATLFAVIYYLGGPKEAFAMIEPEQLDLIRPKESWFTRIDVWFVPIIGAMIAQETIARSLGCQNQKDAQKSAFLASGFYLLFGAIPILLGLLGAHIPLNLENSEDFLPALAQLTLSPVIYILFMGGVVSVILSTIDTSLLSVGALAGHNLFPTNRDDKKQLRNIRFVVIGAGVLSCLFALNAESIYGLVLEADALGTAGIIVVTTAALFTRFGGPISASATFLVALVSSFSAKHFFHFEAPFMLSLALAIITFVALAPVDAARARRA